jgi:gluconolactonase
MSGGGLIPAPSPCVGSSFPAPTLTGLTPTRVAGVPPLDGFNNNGTAAFTIIEGPVWTGDNLYVSEISYLTQAEAMQGTVPPPSRILRVTAAGQVSVAVPDAGTNGLAVDSLGNLLGCDHKNGAITRFMLPGFTPSPVLTGYQNMRFDSPNDLVLGPDGTLYFSDPDYQAARMRPQTATRLYRLPSGATEAVVVDEMRRQPNGVSLSPKGDVLYLSSQDGVYQYPISGGTVGAGTRLTQSPASGDGMAVDCGGNLYVTSGNAVVVLSPAGTQLGQITVSGVQSVTNAAFGGSDRKTLYITALGSTASMGGGGTGGRGGGGPGGPSMMAGLFKVTMNLPGYPY